MEIKLCFILNVWNVEWYIVIWRLSLGVVLFKFNWFIVSRWDKILLNLKVFNLVIKLRINVLLGIYVLEEIVKFRRGFLIVVWLNEVFMIY